MKKVLGALLLALVTMTTMSADYSDGDLRKNDYKWTQLNVYHAQNLANAFGDTYHDTYLEIEGGGRSGVLDLYYFFDVNNLLDSGHNDNHGDFFTKITPRFSIDAMTGKDLSVGPVKEWFVATQYKGFNDGETYYLGLGTNLEVPGFDAFSANLYGTWGNTSMDEATDANWDYTGMVLAVNWYTVLATFENGSNLTYQGWADYGFGNDHSKNNNGKMGQFGEVSGGTSDEFQMFNGFFWNKDNYSLSYSVKFHNHFTYHNTEKHDAISHFFGLSYRM